MDSGGILTLKGTASDRSATTRFFVIWKTISASRSLRDFLPTLARPPSSLGATDTVLNGRSRRPRLTSGTAVWVTLVLRPWNTWLRILWGSMLPHPRPGSALIVEGFYGYQLAYIQNRKLSEKTCVGYAPIC